jgi:TatD DNase family protein
MLLALRGRLSRCSRCSRNAPLITKPMATSLLRQFKLHNFAFDKNNNQPILIDVDANLLHPQLKHDLPKHLERASQAGVSAMLVPASNYQSALEMVEFNKQIQTQDHIFLRTTIPSILSTVGVHPYEATVDEVFKMHETMHQFRQLLEQYPTLFVAVGECGLDYSAGFPKKDYQQQLLSLQIDLAIEYNLPLYVHVRDAFDDFFALMDEKENNIAGNIPPIIIHCYTGTASELQVCIQRNYSISVSGLICRENTGHTLREALRSTFLAAQSSNSSSSSSRSGGSGIISHAHLLMVETDAPYLGFTNSRIGYNDKKKKKQKQKLPNVPSSLPLIVHRLANVLHTTPSNIAKITSENAKNFFGF